MGDEQSGNCVTLFQSIEHVTEVGTQTQQTESFGELGLHADIVANLRNMDIVIPTEIQVRFIPLVKSIECICRRISCIDFTEHK